LFYTYASFVLHFFLHSTAELKVVLKRKKLAVSGKKSVLLERLKDAFRVQGDHVDQALGLQSYKLLDSTKNEGEENGEENDEENDEDEDDDDLVIGNEDENKSFKKKQKRTNEETDEHEQQPTHMQQAERVLKQVFKFQYFRPSQKWAINRLLENKSTLVVASTGSGKSLIYQIPSFILPGMTLVISPLLSLIQDQMDSLPAALPGACLTSNMTAEETGHVLRDLRDRRVKGMLKCVFPV